MDRRIALAGAALGAALLMTPAAADVAYECPPVMRGVSLVLKSVDGGVTIDFTSRRGDQARELRRQLRDAAVVIELHSKAPKDEPVAVTIPPIDISVDDVGAGARVTIRPERAQDIGELRELAQAFEAIWLRANCGAPPSKLKPIPTVRA